MGGAFSRVFDPGNNSSRGGTAMSTIRSFIKREPVLLAAALAALLSCLLVPPDGEYLSYFDLRTLALLYCLMAVVSGLRTAGLFAHLAHVFCGHASSVRAMGLVLTLLCFFSAMLITNDVALLTFVPFAVVVLGMADRWTDLIHIVVLQTAAANLGSMLTPVGNPQNLYLYSFYDLSFPEFLSILFPYSALSLVLLTAACFLLSNEPLDLKLGEDPGVRPRRMWFYLGLFTVCLLTVVRVLPWPAMLGIVVLLLLAFDRKGLGRADFMLLLTFAAFFIFAGNLARVEAVAVMIRQILAGREYLTSLLASQVISNVPAALLIADFTDQFEALLLGVNIGGLGTPIASLASLISLKLYAHSDHARTGRYLLEFTAVNVLFLLLLSLLVLTL